MAPELKAKPNPMPVGKYTNLEIGPHEPDGFADLMVSGERIGRVYPENGQFTFEPDEYLEGLLIWHHGDTEEQALAGVENTLILTKDLLAMRFDIKVVLKTEAPLAPVAVYDSLDEFIEKTQPHGRPITFIPLGNFHENDLTWNPAPDPVNYVVKVFSLTGDVCATPESFKGNSPTAYLGSIRRELIVKNDGPADRPAAHILGHLDTAPLSAIVVALREQLR